MFLFRSQIYWIVFSLAALARIGLLWQVFYSPLRYFHKVPGLDMTLLLEFCEWGNGKFPPFFTVHRTIGAIIWSVNGKNHSVEAFFVLQNILGILSALLVTWIVLSLSGKRLWALLAGVFAAWYGPALMYEDTVLQESIVCFTLLLSFAAFVWTLKRRFDRRSAIIAGVLLGVACLGRPTAGLWAAAAVTASIVYLLRKKRFPLYYAAGFAVFLLLLSLLSYAAVGHGHVFYTVLPYASEVNQVTPVSYQESAVNVNKLQALAQIGVNALKRSPLLWSAHEIPENINYYFLKQHFTVLFAAVGPALLLPPALAGALLLLFRRRLLCPESLILLLIACMLLPLSANYPIGRYRLSLYPYFCMTAGYALWRLQSGKKNWRWTAAALILLIFALNRPPRELLRSSDFISWGHALAADPHARENPLDYYYLAYDLSNGNQAAAVNILSTLIPAGELKAAESLLDDALTRPNINPSLMYYYYGLVRLLQNQPARAEEFFAKVRPEDLQSLQKKYIFYYEQSKKLQRQNEEPHEKPSDIR